MVLKNLKTLEDIQKLLGWKIYSQSLEFSQNDSILKYDQKPNLISARVLDNGTSTILVGTSSGSQPLQDDVMSNAEAVAQAIGARLFAPVFLEAEDSVATLYNAMISVVDAHESMSGLTRRVTSDT